MWSHPSDFSLLGTFGKNFAINSATGGIGSKGKWLTRVGMWGVRQGIEIGGDTTYDVLMNGHDPRMALFYNTIGSIGGEALGRGLIYAGRGFVKRLHVNPSALVHLTKQENVAAIKASKKVGGAYSIFALDQDLVPRGIMQNIRRNIKSFVLGDLSGEIQIPNKALELFKAPPIFGPVSILRRYMGVRSSPLGSINILDGTFTPFEIFIKKEGGFRPATQWEIFKYNSHQFVLDYGYDCGLYVGAGIAAWIGPSTIYNHYFAK